MAAAAVVVVNGSYRAKLLAWWLASMRMCAYMCVCVYVCMYVCVYVCARMFERGAPGPGLAWPGLARAAPLGWLVCCDAGCGLANSERWPPFVCALSSPPEIERCRAAHGECVCVYVDNAFLGERKKRKRK